MTALGLFLFALVVAILALSVSSPSGRLSRRKEQPQLRDLLSERK